MARGELKLGLNTGYWAGGPPQGVTETIAGRLEMEDAARALQFVRSLLFAIWGLAPDNDPPPRVLLERGSD